MLPKLNRLRARKDFDSVWKQGRSAYGQALGIKFAPNQLKGPRFGIVVGLKVHKRATKRNLARRRIREALRREFAPHIQGVDVVVITKPEIIGKPYKEVAEELEKLFKRAKLI